ncbi:alanine racemase [Cutibacterium acnes JCM 18916]|nr:alanine racemase [Cutibacterium acnes JCM 18916]
MPRCPSPSHAIIDLSAIAANLAVVRKRAGDRKVLFAVKADAYGHGAVEVSRYVEKNTGMPTGSPSPRSLKAKSWLKPASPCPYSNSPPPILGTWMQPLRPGFVSPWWISTPWRR